LVRNFNADVAFAKILSSTPPPNFSAIRFAQACLRGFLVHASATACQLLAPLRQGIDSAEEKRKRRDMRTPESDTFGALAQDYLDRHTARLIQLGGRKGSPPCVSTCLFAGQTKIALPVNFSTISS
jgi:hypothetical protein